MAKGSERASTDRRKRRAAPKGRRTARLGRPPVGTQIPHGDLEESTDPGFTANSSNPTSSGGSAANEIGFAIRPSSDRAAIVSAAFECSTDRARDALSQATTAANSRMDAATDSRHRDLVMSSSLGASVIGLVRTIEDEILPRLKTALESVAGGAPAAPRPTLEQVTQLARLAISRDETASQQYVDGLLEAGTSLDVIYGHLLLPTARRLGEFWIDDYCDFSEVTVGLIRLQNIQRRLSGDFRRTGGSLTATTVSRLARRRALIVPMPGDQHTFGTTMVQDYFARAGWDVCGWPPACEADLVQMVRHDSYDMVGLAVSCEQKLQELTSCIALIRRASRNKSVVVAVGGPVFLSDPMRAEMVGADATGATGPEAVAAVDAALTRKLEPAVRS